MSESQAVLVEAIRARLERLGWSQRMLARRAGITDKHMSQLMTGSTQGTLVMWTKILAVLGLRMAVVDD